MNDEMKNNNSSRQILISVLGVVVLIVAVIGVSFAAFTYTGTGEKDNTITTGAVSMTYTESTNGISIVNAQAISDEQGKVLSADNEMFDFVVSSTISGDTTINYDVVAVKQPVTNALNDNQVKLYLEKSADGKVYTEAKAPTVFTPSVGATTNGGPAGSMLLYTGSHTASTTDYFRLRMWLDQNNAAEVGSDPAKTYTVRVNVYAKSAE